MSKRGWVLVAVGLWGGGLVGVGTAAELRTVPVEEWEGLRLGKGMKQSLPAELNGYPGPVHVVEFARELSLTPQQEAAARGLVQEMTAQAVAVGQQILDQEARLDQLFADQRASTETVAPLVMELGAQRGKLRLIHLNAHMEITKMLSPEQIKHYQHLRSTSQTHTSAGGHAGH